MTKISGAARRFVWLSIYAIAMGFLEAVVVMYLRALYYPSGFQFPLVPIPLRLAAAEIAREAATILMLLSVAMLAGRDAVDRFFVFALLFGIWDIVYYLGLLLGLGWPPSLLTWDILFLIPVPWVAPVLYPLVVSVSLLLGTAGYEALAARGRSVRPTVPEWGLASLGCVLVIVSFCWNYRPAAEGRMPTDFPIAVFTAGLLLGVGPVCRAMIRSLR